MSRHPKPTRLLALGLAAPLVVSLAACGSQVVDGQGSGGIGSQPPSSSTPATGGGSSTSTPTSPAPSSSSSAATSPQATLAARLAQGYGGVKTAHLNLQIAAAGQVISGSGDEQLSNAKLVALDLNESVGSLVSLRLIIIGGKKYVKLPKTLNHSGKPWQLVTASSSDPTVRSLASSLSSTQTSVSLQSVIEFVAAARTVKVAGTGTHDGLATTTYNVDVDPQKLPDSYQGKQALVAAGVTSIPVSVIIDAKGRPFRVTENLAVEGHRVNVKVTISRYNLPVHITAPPAKQVSSH